MLKSTQTADVEFIGDLPKELLNTIGKYTKQDNEYTDTRLFERKNLEFRTIVDNVFPTMLILDYNNIAKELKKYNDVTKSLKETLGDRYDPKLEKDYSQNKLSDKEVELIVKIIRDAAKNYAEKSLGVTQRNLLRQINTIVTYDKEYNTVLQGLNELFVDVLYLSDASGPSRDVFLYSNFELLTRGFTRELNKVISLNPVKGVQSISQLLDYGHTAVGYQDSENSIKLQFNSPKVINIIFDVISDTSGSTQGLAAAQQASVNFIQQTGQIEEYITIEKEFSEGFVKVFVSIGGNIVRFENSVVNQRRGSILERNINTLSNTKTLQKLATLIGSVGGSIAQSVKGYLLRGRSSPSVLDHITNSIMAAIRGQKISQVKTAVSKSNKTKIAKQVPVISGFTSGVKKLKRPAKLAEKSAPLLSGVVSQENKLLALQNLLDANLVQTVKQNMGTGSRRDILNLRSGRFAESVAVQRLTEGRAGMITAYYDYMRYPYATFSAGGKQESPRSRDPKLLISKSIRELAAQAKITRLRAVLV